MKILFIPMDAHGHLNSCIGLARMLRDFGHECIFIVPKHWTVLVKGHNFTMEYIYDSESVEDQDPQEKWGKFMKNTCHTFQAEPIDQLKQLYQPACEAFVAFAKKVDDQFSQIIHKVEPDVIIVDLMVPCPAVILSGRPWLLLFSSNPLRLLDGPNIPPHGFGYNAQDDPKLFSKMRSISEKILENVKKNCDEWLISKGITPDTGHDMIIKSPYLNIYSYPAELDYTEFGLLPDNFFRLEHMVRLVDDAPLGFDESYFELPDKKIFFSLGSMGGSDVDLMKRLISFMAKSKHRFIVSKGPFPDEIELAANMVGGKYINQMKILPKVDLVITHGGNNTFVETLYFGKPMIVLPLFGDQHDNGRRAEDKKIGRTFRPHKVTQDQLLEAIEEILNDIELIQRVAAIGENIRNSKSHAEFDDKLKKIVKNNEQ